MFVVVGVVVVVVVVVVIVVVIVVAAVVLIGLLHASTIHVKAVILAWVDAELCAREIVFSRIQQTGQS